MAMPAPRLMNISGMPISRRLRERAISCAASWRIVFNRSRLSLGFGLASAIGVDSTFLTVERYWPLVQGQTADGRQRTADEEPRMPFASVLLLSAVRCPLSARPLVCCLARLGTKLAKAQSRSGCKMTLVNSLCAEISIYQGVGEPTGVVVERSAIRGKKGLCKSMRDLAIKARMLGDGYYYIPIELWPKSKQPVVVHKHDWTVIGSIPRTSRSAKRRVKQAS